MPRNIYNDFNIEKTTYLITSFCFLKLLIIFYEYTGCFREKHE